MRYHFIGINGVGMNGLAKLILELGHQVSGCDLNKSQISNLKSQILLGHSVDHITKDLDGVVVTSAALHTGSPAWEEIGYAKKLGIKVIKRSQLIGRLMNDKIGIAIAGMHGKTTTSSMITHILMQAGYDPTFLVGGEVRNIGASERLGKGKYFVAEACEYDRQFLDFRPKIAVITNIEPEHLDTYPGGLQEIKKAFKKFIRLLPANGLLVVNQDDANVMSLIKAAKCKVKRVTINKLWPGLKLQIPGRHILFDATLAARVAHEIGINHETIKNALNNFAGAKRRFEIKGEKDGVIVVDDYGHHPTEIQATIQAAREQLEKSKIQNPKSKKNPKSQISKSKSYQLKAKSSKLIVVFQPHQYMRTKLLFKDFVKCFDGADKVIITDIYLIAGREPAEARADFSRDLVEAIKTRCHSELVSESLHSHSEIPINLDKLRRRISLRSFASAQDDKCNVKYIPLNHGTTPKNSFLSKGLCPLRTEASSTGQARNKGGTYREIVNELKKTAQLGDLILTLGATDIYKVGEEFLAK